MIKTLVLFAHPRIDRSEANVALVEAARRVAGVTVVDLYAEYPTFEIDVDREQQRLLDHDAIVFQHPVYWYSCPALLKEWLDLVLEHGFAYGAEGRALEGKLFLNAVTCGARREVYARDGGYHYELKDFFVPFEQTALLCRMRYLPPFALFAAGHAADEDRLDEHVATYSRLLTAITAGKLDLDGDRTRPSLSDDLADLLEDSPREVR
jgi:putative NADPH-quinone reductase